MNIVVLAAGQGKRMASPLPKLLHPLAGRPLLQHVLDSARQLAPRALVVVIGHAADRIRHVFDAPDLIWADQPEQKGTGDAVRHALPVLSDDAVTLILAGDVPLIRAATLERLARASNGSRLALLTQHVDDPKGYGRIVRDDAGAITRIVEDKDASEDERRIREINTGIMAVPTARLAAWLARLTTHNAQGEYYLTDIFAMARDDGVAIVAEQPASAEETAGVNSQRQLAALERALQKMTAERLMDEGVMLADPARLDVRGSLACGSEVRIDINCVFLGNVRLGSRVQIGAHCVLHDVEVGDDVVIEPFSHLREARIGHSARIGPYARLRPGTQLAAETHIGNFVEVKNATLGKGSKANHLSYLGDATIGAGVNVGAGTITCNYDGAEKHQTVIEDDVHIGSDVQLVAPVTVGRGATIGAGTTVWKDIAPDTLTVNPKTQTSRRDWSRPRKK